jgi:hypothetical protein
MESYFSPPTVMFSDQFLEIVNNMVPDYNVYDLRTSDQSYCLNFHTDWLV